jgi:hypothetical protein
MGDFDPSEYFNRRIAERREIGEPCGQEPLVDELRAHGFEVDSPADLHNQRMDYRDAIPVLLKWLPKVESPLKDDVVRALSVEWARPTAAPLLIEEFRRPDGPESELGLRWTIGNALAVVADDSVIDPVIELATDPRWGRSREMIVVALGNMKDPRTVETLRALLDDEEVAAHAVVALGKLGAVVARGDLERFLDHPKTWVRKEAENALRRIDDGTASR